ncbi:MAG: hypothetical protein HY064_16870 [Bacteroidetes bacterium]|nr:hypothetical protein [Bacteroidota bacterium]
MRKIALIGIASAAALTVVAVIFGYPPAVAGVHALPFCLLLLLDSSRNRKKNSGNENTSAQS